MTADIISAMNDPEVFGRWFSGPSWEPWRVVLRGAFGLPMTDADRDLFRVLAERDPPARRVRELWVVAGRRAGKDSAASLMAAYAASYGEFAPYLRPGERALVMCLATDRDQAKIVLNYTKAYFDAVPMLGAMIERDTVTGLELSNNTEIAVATNNYRAVRGRAIALAIFDECAFWRDETSSSPDLETYRAIVPGLATIPGSMIVGISSPYWQRGLLYYKFRKHFGQNDDDVLVIKAPSLALNPTLDASIVERAIEEDPDAAAAEWLAEFRRDVSGFIDRDAVDAVIAAGRHELPPIAGVAYVAFVDPSGGSADSFTLAIAHRAGDGRAVLDAVRERKPPFSPEGVVEEYADLMKAYGIATVGGDRYAGEWPREQFRKHGIEYEPSETPKSGIYLAMLPLINSGQVELLDHPRMIAQLVGLERRTARGGRDTVDHGPSPSAKDDIVNAAAGALVAAARPHGPTQNYGLYAFMKNLAAAIAAENKPPDPPKSTPARGSVEWAAAQQESELG